MTKRTGMMFAALIVLSLCSYPAAAQAAQPPQQSATKQESTPLYDEIARMDATMFAAFNAHDGDKLMSFFSDKLEFYHDLGGLQSYSDVAAGFKRMFAQNNGMRRELVNGTLEVYPIKDYGAIETGTHRFCHTEEGKEICGTFKFLHIWQKEGTAWKVTRVVSYGH
jgi:ketosteroid isomerase-like protein